MSETFSHVRLSGTKQGFQKIFCPCFTWFNDLEICRLQLLNSLWQPLCEALGLLRTEISLVSLYSLSSKCRPVSHFNETVDNSSHMLQTASTVRQAGEFQGQRFSSLHEVLITTGSGKHKGGVVVVILETRLWSWQGSCAAHVALWPSDLIVKSPSESLPIANWNLTSLSSLIAVAGQTHRQQADTYGQLQKDVSICDLIVLEVMPWLCSHFPAL